MIQEVILHIGMPKTGSSSIQASLNEYDDGKIRYAHFDSANHSMFISTIFSKNPAHVRTHKKFGHTEKERAILKKKYTAQLETELHSSAQKLIISAEKISAKSDVPVENLRDYLSKLAIKTSVIAYVRPPVGFASSAFQQRLKGQDSRVMDLNDPIAIPQPEYRQRFEKFIDSFGAENVTFVKFSKDVIQGDVVDHFCQMVGIPEGKVTGKQTNESLPLEAVGLLYDFSQNGPVNLGAPNLLVARRHLIRTLGGLFDTRFQIPVDLITENWDISDIEWMEGVGGFDLRPTESEMGASAGSSSSLQEYVTPISGGTIRILKNICAKKASALCVTTKHCSL